MEENLPDKSEKLNHIGISLFFAVSLSAIFTVLSIYLSTGKFGGYGASLFVLTPALSGFISSLTLTLQKEYKYKFVLWVGLIPLLLAFILIFIFAMEGVICLLMASPIFIIANLFGSVIGHTVGRNINKKQKLPVLFAIIILNPTAIALENNSEIKATKMTTLTTLVVNAPAEVVWESLVKKNSFSGFDNFFFRSGVAYPKSTELISSNSKNYFVCDYSQGKIAIPVQSLTKNKVLQFAFTETPAPMKELSFYPDLELPHLHGYFNVISGQIKLTALPGNQTKLTATTIYSYKIKPIIYWKNWTNYLLNEVHYQVLSTIKENSESRNILKVATR